eukprot:3208825-Pleurochrysis_carterae.AAC.2
MAVTIADFEAGTATMGDAALAGFVNRLAASFLFAGEAKWWDAATVVSLAELISGYDDGAGTSDSGVCTEWSATDGFAVSLTWNANADADNKLPYGSVVPKPAIGPAASFCVAGSSDNMQACARNIRGRHEWTRRASVGQPCGWRLSEEGMSGRWGRVGTTSPGGLSVRNT